MSNCFNLNRPFWFDASQCFTFVCFEKEIKLFYFITT